MKNLWGILWRSDNKLDGNTEHLIYSLACVPMIFKTRGLARKYINSYWGYLRTRPDLRREPHGWKIPIPVKVEVTVKGR
jgi:hypothetical protein